MTEDEWRTCSNIGEMLWKLEGKASNRKLILFCCACCRRLEHLLADGRSRRSLDAAEEGADGLVSKEEMGQLQRQAERAIQQICSVYRRTVSLELLANGNAAQAAMSAAESVARLGDTNFDLLYHVELVALKARDCLAHFAAK